MPDKSLLPLSALCVAAMLVVSQPAAAQTGPIRMGFLTVRTGPLAAPVYSRDFPPSKNLEP